MPITSVSRWKIDRSDAQKLAEEAAPLLKKHGASLVRLAFCHSGQFTGQTLVVTLYADWQSYGRAMEAQMQDPAWQSFFSQALGKGELQDRSVLVTQDL
jgi:hypothetical protein